MRLSSHSADRTRALAAALGRALASETDGLVVALVGPLGAGKTEWVRGLAAGLGIDPAHVASPTFMIACDYPGPRSLTHMDLYRLRSEAELEATGFLDLLAPGTLLAIEWADRLPEALPADRLEVRIRRGEDPEMREFDVAASGPVSEAAARRWQAALSGS